MRISNRQGAGSERLDLVINRGITWNQWSGVERLLRKWYLADRTNLDGQKLKAPRDEFEKVGLRQWMNSLQKWPTKIKKLMHIGMYFISPMLLLLFLIKCRYWRQWGRNSVEMLRLRSISSHLATLSYIWIPTLLGTGSVNPILCNSYGGSLRTVNIYLWQLHQWSIQPICQSWMLQSPLPQAPAASSESIGAAGRSLMEMGVHTPVLLPQSWTTILLLDG
jgi:hypothetical protein